MTRIIQATQDAIAEAAAILRAGGIVAMPTETVYGLAGNALDGAAVARIYEAKGRPSFNPLIAHFESLDNILNNTKLEGGILVGNPRVGEDSSGGQRHWPLEEMVKTLAQAFWPGPLTMVLPRSENSEISELATAGLDTIAVRMPAHPAARALIAVCGFPLVAPSANASGKLSPTTPAHVADSLGNKVDMILAAGSCEVGLESTVLDLSGARPLILRPGVITAEDIAAALGCDPQAIILHNSNIEGPDAEGAGFEAGAEGPRAPGMLLRHYAPETPLRLDAIDLEPGEALLAFGSVRFMGVKGGGAAKDLPPEMLRNLSEGADLHEAAANLFAMLKELDRAAARRIAVMNIPDAGLGVAINDRLRRAARG